MTATFWTQYLLALAVVGLMLFGLYSVVRGLTRGRMLAANGRRLLGVVDSIALSQNTTLHVVKAGGRYLIVGGGAGHLSAMGELDAAEVDAWIAEQQRGHERQLRSMTGLVERLRGKRS